MIAVIENLYANHQLVFWVISIVIAALISWFFARNMKAKISYCCHHNNIVKNNKTLVDGLKIKFKNKPIETLSVSRFLIFNNGKKVIMGNDVSSNDMFGIKLTNGEILTAEVMNHNDNFSKPQLQQIGKNKLKIKFHHINPKGAILIQLSHTAPDKSDVQVECCAAGLDKVKKVSINKTPAKARLVAGIASLIYLTIFVLILFNKEAYMEYLSTCNPSQKISNALWSIGGCTIVLVYQFIYFMGYTWRWRYWGRFASENNFWDKKN